MIHHKKKSECCGCEACVQRCPKNCILLKEDEEGFLYPQVDVSACIECGLCEKVCPVIHQNVPRKPLAVYAAKNPDEEIRRTSSSGGIFWLLVEQTIAAGGVVFGARFNEQWEVVHTAVQTLEEAAAFRGSKYVQSHVGETFIEAEKCLKQGQQVLFSGTPCQIAGLHRFLGKDYENLLSVDIICHGVPSPGVFRWYLKEEMQKVAQRATKIQFRSLPSICSIPERNGFVLEDKGWRVESIAFRDKRLGWKKFSFALSLSKASAAGEKNSVSLSYTLHENLFLRGFLYDLYLRPACYECVAKQLKSKSDITLGDYWKIDALRPDLDDDRGVSALCVNTERGRNALKNCSAINLWEMPYEDLCCHNPALVCSCIKSSSRSVFWKNNRNGFAKRIKKITEPSLKKRFVIFLKVYIKRIVDKIR